ncbi:MAG: hypothetical protein JWL85_373 [Candidatus Saccharibacteria bacterium]|nr:hypothetical protein [Candidatus Saccharibacteria bacterium]
MIYKLNTGAYSPTKHAVRTSILTLAITIGVPSIAALTSKTLPPPNTPWVLSAVDSPLTQNRTDSTTAATANVSDHGQTNPQSSTSTNKQSQPAHKQARPLQQVRQSNSPVGTVGVILPSTSTEGAVGGRGGGDTPPPTTAPGIVTPIPTGGGGGCSCSETPAAPVPAPSQVTQDPLLSVGVGINLSNNAVNILSPY